MYQIPSYLVSFKLQHIWKNLDMIQDNSHKHQKKHEILAAVLCWDVEGDEA